MSNSGKILTEDIPKSIAAEQSVYDNEDRNVGTVDRVDREVGYFTGRACMI